MLASGISPSDVTWDDLPATVAGISGSVTTGALSAGDTVAIPVTEILQAVADGAKWHGFELTTDAAAINTGNFRSFDSGKTAWVLVVEVTDAPDKPTNPRPNDGSVGSGAPTVAWDSGTTSHTQIQVQVDPAANWAAPAYDSGAQTSDGDTWDLSADVTFAAIASGASTQWRVRVGDGTTWSPWSDTASFTYIPDRVLVMDSPTGGTIGDPTFSVLAHLATGTLTKYRIRIAKGADRTDIVYDSGVLPPDGTTIARDIPWRDPNTNNRIIKGDDTSWKLIVRAWPDDDRAEAVGQTSYVEVTVDLTFDNDVNEPPADYTITPATPGSPIHIHTWTRSEAADKWLVMHGSEVLATLTPDDVTVDAGTYTWNDGGFLQPYQALTLHVRAIDAGSRSVASNAVDVMSTPEGFWLIPDDGTEPFQFDGNEVQSFSKNDRRDTFSPVNVFTDVDLVYGFEGVSGAYQGQMDTTTSSDVLGDVDRLETIRRTPTARPRLVWASQSIRAQVKGLFALPSNDITPDNLQHVVTIGRFIQDGD
jgi:hypothetical protein